MKRFLLSGIAPFAYLMCLAFAYDQMNAAYQFENTAAFERGETPTQSLWEWFYEDFVSPDINKVI